MWCQDRQLLLLAVFSQLNFQLPLACALAATILLEALSVKTATQLAAAALVEILLKIAQLVSLDIHSAEQSARNAIQAAISVKAPEQINV